MSKCPGKPMKERKELKITIGNTQPTSPHFKKIDRVREKKKKKEEKVQSVLLM